MEKGVGALQTDDVGRDEVEGIVNALGAEADIVTVEAAHHRRVAWLTEVVRGQAEGVVHAGQAV